VGKRDRERRVFGYTNRGSGVCVGSQVPGDRASPVVSAVASDAFNTTSCLQWTRRTRTELRPVTRGPEWLVGPGSEAPADPCRRSGHAHTHTRTHTHRRHTRGSWVAVSALTRTCTCGVAITAGGRSCPPRLSNLRRAYRVSRTHQKARRRMPRTYSTNVMESRT